MANKIVRENLLTRPGYSPYCGEGRCPHGWPRTTFNGKQFVCKCGWTSGFPDDFIEEYLSARESMKDLKGSNQP